MFAWYINSKIHGDSTTQKKAINNWIRLAFAETHWDEDSATAHFRERREDPLNTSYPVVHGTQHWSISVEESCYTKSEAVYLCRGIRHCLRVILISDIALYYTMIDRSISAKAGQYLNLLTRLLGVTNRIASIIVHVIIHNVWLKFKLSRGDSWNPFVVFFGKTLLRLVS